MIVRSIGQEIPLRLFRSAARLSFNGIVVQIGYGAPDILVRHLAGSSEWTVEKMAVFSIPGIPRYGELPGIIVYEPAQFSLVVHLDQHVNMIDHQTDSENPDIVSTGRSGKDRKESQTIPDRIKNEKTVNRILIDVLNRPWPE